MTTALVWLRDDLRLADNPALLAAAQAGPVVPVYILEEPDGDGQGPRPLGGAARWWLHGSLAALGEALAARGSRLILARGPAAEVIPRLAAACGAQAVHWNRRLEPGGQAVDRHLKASLPAHGLAAVSHRANLLIEPWRVRDGQPYKVFTPFWRWLASQELADPLPAPARLEAPAEWPPSEALDAWALRPTAPDWAGGLRATWTPGEAAAADRLGTFLDTVAGYPEQRDRPDLAATSRLSPHLRFGEISPRQADHAVRLALGAQPERADALAAFRRQLAWREFSCHQLHAFPALASQPLKPAFARFPWRPDDDHARALFSAWSRGRTGIDLIDAGMAELWHSGWMHNRVRMVAASLLTKNLRLPWQWGEAWFWDTLVDADPANNPAGWQWVAGCGADAAPFFRVFNPETQASRFDPTATYRRHWLGNRQRPPPIVNLKTSRAEALAAYKDMGEGA
ncbi:cryptochrome/photolyase family protein [Roseospirillum parvum]|uniref:Deoxyribodipyrimidine photo-lyase n=1 Tax=Roseospirillum parvum TaxID=83401 RepID=A0A1G7TP11_9PROT|nr:deoxyribodipyrimidine photo-lyase [Roseospirillum parvum]SDG37005.1 deoxyribodipyrimidine photo-lyase [Roseospirillum parvum]